MNILRTTKNLLKQYGLTPDRNKSQNFLIDESVYESIVAAAELKSTDTVLEVGPGLGFLTTRLLERALEVKAVELDRHLFTILTQLTHTYDNLELVHQDILAYQEDKLPVGYKLVANIPYHLTGKIIRKFFTSQRKPSLAVLLVQKEVAERICAQPGDHSLLSLAVQYYGRPEVVRVVPRQCFYPSPRVDSAILRVSGIMQDIDLEMEKIFWQVVKHGFSSKRKTLAHNLAAGFVLDKSSVRSIIQAADFPEKVRAQELSLTDWVRLIPVILKEIKS